EYARTALYVHGLEPINQLGLTHATTFSTRMDTGSEGLIHTNHRETTHMTGLPSSRLPPACLCMRDALLAARGLEMVPAASLPAAQCSGYVDHQLDLRGMPMHGLLNIARMVFTVLLLAVLHCYCCPPHDFKQGKKSRCSPRGSVPAARRGA
ncbi:hypothetical protein Dimus_003371, partial [Dionaea muscipula]